MQTASVQGCAFGLNAVVAGGGTASGWCRKCDVFRWLFLWEALSSQLLWKLQLRQDRAAGRAPKKQEFVGDVFSCMCAVEY
jgi:hypothetical protein